MSDKLECGCGGGKRCKTGQALETVAHLLEQLWLRTKDTADFEKWAEARRKFQAHMEGEVRYYWNPVTGHAVKVGDEEKSRILQLQMEGYVSIPKKEFDEIAKAILQKD